MKRIPATLLWASSLLLLLPAASCTDTATGEPDTDARAITFTSAAETRAAVGTDFPDGSSFSVWGWYGTGSQITNDVFDGVPVTKNGETWTYGGGNRYWIAGMTYNFYGVYPVYPKTSSDKGTTATVDATGKITVTNFECSAFGEGTVDLMTATAPGLSGNAAPVVAMEFKHTLTRITFSAKLADRLDAGYSLQVKEVALWASKQGDMTQDMSKPDSKPVWTTEPYLQDGDDEGDINEKYNAYLYRLTTADGALQSTPIPTGDAVLLNVKGKGDLLAIPQKMNYTRPVLAINYTLSYGVSTTSPVWKVYPLRGNTDWTPGASLNYTFTIDEDNAYFTVSVGDWIDGNKGNENVEFD